MAYVTSSTVRCGIHCPLCQCTSPNSNATRWGLIRAFAGSNNRGVAAGILHAEWYSSPKTTNGGSGSSRHACGKSGRPKPLPNALEPVPYATRAAGWKANHPHWAAAGAPVPLPVRVTPRGELPARLASGPTRVFQPISTTPPTGPHGKFCQESGAAGAVSPRRAKTHFRSNVASCRMMPRHLLLLIALILAFSSSAQTFSGAVTDDTGEGLPAPSSPPKTLPATCSATSVFPMGPIPWTSEHGQDNASP